MKMVRNGWRQVASDKLGEPASLSPRNPTSHFGVGVANAEGEQRADVSEHERRPTQELIACSCKK